MKDNLSTSDYADMISESVVNGQFNQAYEQFTRALDDNCNASSLLTEISEQIGAGRALIRVAAFYIEKTKE